MSFSKIRPAGWGNSTTVTSAEMQALDADHAKALDKTGDAIGTGVTISWSGGSALTMSNGSTFAVNGTGYIGATGGLVVQSGGSIIVQSGATLNPVAGSTSLFAGTTTFAGNVTVQGTGVTLSTASSGRIVMGDSDYPVLGGGHPGASQPVWYWFDYLTAYASGVTYTGAMSGISGATPGQIISLPLPRPWQGATLTTAELYFTPATSHSGLPNAGNITASLLFRTPTVGVAFPGWSTLGSPAVYSPVSLTDYNNGKIHSLTLTQGSPVVDRGTNQYAIQITEENNSPTTGFGGTIFHGVKLTYTIANLRPQ